MSRTKRLWTIADFAEHAGISVSQARRLLKRLDDELEGKLLLRSSGTNRRYTFVRAALARARPEYFAPVESLEERIDVLEELVAEVRRSQKIIATQVGQNTRGLERVGRMLAGRAAHRG